MRNPLPHVNRIVEIVHREVPVEKIIERTVVRTEPPVLEELLRRIRYDPANQCIVYRDPDTRNLLKIERIPDVAVDFVRFGRAKSDQAQKLAAQFATMDDENFKRQYEANPQALFANIRLVSAALRRAQQRYLARARPVT